MTTLLTIALYLLGLATLALLGFSLLHQPARQRRNVLILFGISALLFAGVTYQLHTANHQSKADSVTSTPANRHLVWFGGYVDMKTLTVQQMNNAARSFDGFVVQPVYGSKDNAARGESLGWEVFNKGKHYTVDPTDTTKDYIGDTASYLASLPSTPLPDRYLRINTSPYHLKALGFDWEDDTYWDSVISNVQAAAQMAAQDHMKGIFLDTENYDEESGGVGYYTYAQLVKNDPRYQGTTPQITFAQADADAEARGAQFMQAINQYLPSTEIYYSFSYTWVSQHVSRAHLSSGEDSLLIAFEDGMLHASTPTTTFIDGFEYSYSHNDNPAYFTNWDNVIKGTGTSTPYNINFQKYKAQYQAQFKAGFGFDSARDMDVNDVHNLYSYCGVTNPSQTDDFYTPERMAWAIQEMLTAGDGYAWVWSGSQNYWLDPSDSKAVPRIYVDALRYGQQHAADPSLPALAPDPNSLPLSIACRTQPQITVNLNLRNRPTDNTSTVSVKVTDASNKLIGTTTGTTSSDGTLALNDPAFIAQIQTFGTYNLEITPKGYIAQSVANISSPLTKPVSLTSTPFVGGDFNGTGKIELGDIVTAIRAFNGKSTDTTLAVYPNGPKLSDLVSLIHTFNTGQ